MRIALALALGCSALAAAAPAARADGLAFGFSYSDGDHDHGHGHGRRHRVHRHRDEGFAAFVGIGFDAVPRRAVPPPVLVRRVRPAPVVVVEDCCRTVWIPERIVFREEVVCEPAVWDTRCVPVYDEVCEPLYDERWDPVACETVRVRVGERHRRVQVGERTERVLVRPETSRVVRVPETIPGRFVRVCDHGHDHGGDVLTPDAYEALVIDRPPVGGTSVALGFGVRR